MGDIESPGQAAELQRQLKSAAALALRSLVWIAAGSIVAAILAMFAWGFVMWLVFGVLLIYAAFLAMGIYLEDPAPGLRAVEWIGLAVVTGGLGTLITGHAVWVVIQLSRSGLGWLRAKRAKLKGVVR